MADDLLHRLGAIERDDDAAYPREWEQVVAGTLSAEEALLRRPQDSAADQEAYQKLFTPMSEATSEALVDRLQAALAEQKADPNGEKQDDSAAPSPSVEPISLAAARTKRRRTWLATAGTLVAAAAVFALWLRPIDSADPGVASDTFASYSLVIRNTSIRGDRSGDDSQGDRPEANIDRYRSDSMLHWVLSPDEAQNPDATASLSLRAWAINGAEERTITPTRGLTISESGVVVLRGSLSQLFDLPPGRWTIHLALTTQDLPETLTAAKQAAARSGAQFVAPLTIEVIE